MQLKIKPTVSELQITSQEIIKTSQNSLVMQNQRKLPADNWKKGKITSGLNTDNNHSLTNGQEPGHWSCKCDSVQLNLGT
jgi:hypothetical protein